MMDLQIYEIAHQGRPKPDGTGKKVGISQAHIAKIEGGKVDPRYSTVSKIFHCLKEEEKDYCKKYMTAHIYGIQEDEKASSASKIMRDQGISQVIVFRDETVVGMITEEDLLRHSGEASPELMRSGDIPQWYHHHFI